MRKSVFTTVMAAVFAVMAMTPAFAGSLDQAASPTSAGGGAMYTLEDIYQRLLNGTVATKRVGPFKEPTLGPGRHLSTASERNGCDKACGTVQRADFGSRCNGSYAG